MKRHPATLLLVSALALGPMILAAHGQVLPRNRNPGKAQPPAPTAPAPVAGETPGETRREGRQEARDNRADAKAGGETRPEARETARDTRQQTRQNIQASRAADFGVWFSGNVNQGLVIDDLSDKGVFASAGFQAGDKIVSINGQPVTSEAQFVQFLTAPNVSTRTC
jgi:membrane-associated protease RseP (regulator of RpoE activity)